MQILINNTDYNMVVSLMSNISITGSYISAKQASIDRLEQIVNKALIKNVPATLSLNPISVALSNNVALQSASLSTAVAAKTTVNFGGANTQPRLSVNTAVSAAALPVSASINNIASAVAVNSAAVSNEPVNKPNVNANLTNRLVVKVGDAAMAQSVTNFAPVGVFAAPVIIDNNIRTYDDVIKYFKSAGYFVTGTTSTKLQTLIASFVDIKPAATTSVVNKVGVYDVANVAFNTNLQQVQRASASSVSAVSAIANIAAQSTAASVFSASVANPRAMIQNQAIVNTAAAEAVTSKMIVSDNSVVDRTHKRILIPGTGVVGMILGEGTISEYILYLDTPNPIKYIDFPDGRTIFIYKRADDVIDNTGNMILYPGLIEEPKIISEVFIDRGANNAFEPVKRLKNVKSLNELTKLGLGYYKINTKGFNFKNL